MKSALASILLALGIAATGVTATPRATTQAPADEQPGSGTPNDYSRDDAWLCRPGRSGGHDACDVDMTTTVVAADGALSKETWAADADAPIDCFYVYPTVSAQPTPNANMHADPAEIAAVHAQLARFASKCRPYAPLYRQVTLAGLLTRMAGGASPAFDRGLAYDDVRDAWNYYLQHDNHGRGVILIGHSQGSFVLLALIANEIDGKAVQSRLVSAMLMGATLAVPKGKDVGGTFKHIPLCHAASDTGCVIVYSSFRASAPPPANSLFGRVTDPLMTAACTNPAALGGGRAPVHSYFSAAFVRPWLTAAQPIATPWVSVPGLIEAQCATTDSATYLGISIRPNDPRAKDIAGDTLILGRVQPNWGLHLIDVSVAMGDLVDLAGTEARAFHPAAKP